MMSKGEFPKEYFVKIENEPHYEGRIVISPSFDGMNAEIDIVQGESKKIFQHVDRLYKLEDEQDAVDSAMLRLSQFLKTGK